jgi:hypothetical protein
VRVLELKQIDLDLGAEPSEGTPPIDDDFGDKSGGRDDDFAGGCTGHACDEGDACLCYRAGYADGAEDGWITGYMAVTGSSLAAAEAAYEDRAAAR